MFILEIFVAQLGAVKVGQLYKTSHTSGYSLRANFFWGHFSFSMYIYFAIHLDISHVLIHSIFFFERS